MDVHYLIILTVLAVVGPSIVVAFILIAREWPNTDTFGRVLLGAMVWVLLILGFWLTQFPGSPLGIVRW